MRWRSRGGCQAGVNACRQVHVAVAVVVKIRADDHVM
jgi:hypothetical protein